MAFCTQCGRQLDPQARFCDRCGTPVSSVTVGTAVRPVHHGYFRRGKPKRASAVREFFSGVRAFFCLLYAYREDTETVPEKDRNENRAVAVLCYLHFLVIVPYLTMRESAFTGYHTERGGKLFLYHVIYEAGFYILFRLFGAVPVLGVLLWVLFSLGEAVLWSFSVFGIRAVLRGKAWTLLLLEPRKK